MRLQKLLFGRKFEKQAKARIEFLTYVDTVIDSSYGVELVANCPHGCINDDNRPVIVMNSNNIDIKIKEAHHKSTYESLKHN